MKIVISSLHLLLCWGYLWKLSPLCAQWFTTALHCLVGLHKKCIYCMRNDEGSKSRSSEWYPRWNLPSKCFMLIGSTTVRIFRISWSVIPRRWIPEEEPTLKMVFCCKEHKTLLLCYSTCDSWTSICITWEVGSRSSPDLLNQNLHCNKSQGIHLHIKAWESLSSWLHGHK